MSVFFEVCDCHPQRLIRIEFVHTTEAALPISQEQLDIVAPGIRDHEILVSIRVDVSHLDVLGEGIHREKPVQGQGAVSIAEQDRYLVESGSDHGHVDMPVLIEISSNSSL